MGAGRGGDGGAGGGGGGQMLINGLGSTSATQRAQAVRELCVSGLGPVLFEVRAEGAHLCAVLCRWLCT